MRTRYTVIREVYVAFENGDEVWFLDSARTRNDDVFLGPEHEVRALICKRHGFVRFPPDWEITRIPDVRIFERWFGIR